MSDVAPLMNDTKWDEVRLAMHALGGESPKWRTKDLESGYVSDWEREWYYHFRVGGYAMIEWLEIGIDTPDQGALVRSQLSQIGLPGVETTEGFRVLGYAPAGQCIDYIR